MVPFTGLGLYNGFRGNRWLRNRITIFKQFVIPSLKAQTNHDFILWVAWRYQEKYNSQVKELEQYLKDQGFKVVFTFSGIPFWDDKYPDLEAQKRLVDSLHGAMGELFPIVGEADTVLMTIQPSDDCYFKGMVEETHKYFEENPTMQVYGYQQGYVMTYSTGQIAEWNPKTTPPFYTIRYPKNIFIDPLKHTKYIGPYKSHEYLKDFMSCMYMNKRGFLVGTHGENISTVFDHPYAQAQPWTPVGERQILEQFGLEDAGLLQLKWSLRKWFFHKLPYRVKRKLRFWSERSRVFSFIYWFLRN